MTKKIIFGGLGFLAVSLGASEVRAAQCTATTITNALKSKKKFVWAGTCDNKDIKVSKPISVGSGMTVDGSGQMRLIWSGKHPCDEKPSNETIFTITGSGSILKNFTIAWSPEGIHLKGNNNLVDNVTYEKICEDGLTNWGKNNVVQNSLFQNAPDKCIQTNGGSAKFYRNEFRNCPRSIGSCSDKADPGNHPMANCKVASFNTAIENKIYGCGGGYAMRASGKISKKANGWLRAERNEFYDCKGALQSEEDGVVYALENLIKGGIAFKTLHNGHVEDCRNTVQNATYAKGKAPVKNCSWE